MSAVPQTLERIFGVPFSPQAALTELRQYHHPNTYCCNAQGELIGIFSSEHDCTSITIPADWQALEYLNLSDNKHLQSLTFAAALPRLQHLDVSDCELSELMLPAGFDALRWLDVSRNKLQSAVLEGAFPALEYLDLSRNELSSFDLPEVAPKLQYIYLLNNQLKQLSFSTNLPELEVLHLRKNQLVEINLSRGFQNLETLYLQENKITNIPVTFLDNLVNLQGLYLKDNPIENIAKELFDKDESVLEDVRNALLALSKGAVENNEVKMILVGNSTVGKTTLVKYLRTGKFEDGENTTHGIRVDEWQPKRANEGDKALNVLVWDFGGQEYYHATHRLFLSNNAVYCLLWNKATNVQDKVLTKLYKNEELIEQELEHYPYTYWLKNIRNYAPDSPILLAQSRGGAEETISGKVFEEFKIEPKKNYQVCVSHVAKGDPNMEDEFRIFKRQLVSTLEATATKFKLGKYWVQIRDELRNKADAGQYRMTWEEYVAFCQSVDETMQESEVGTLTNYLKEIGTILYYPKYPGLEEVVFIKPTWVTDRIYDIFNEEVQENEGEFDLAHIVSVLEDEKIGNSEPERAMLSQELRDLMLAFELIFSPKDKLETFFAIQYLPDAYARLKALERQKKMRPHLGFKLYYPDFLPKPVFHRFIAEYGKYAVDEFWKYGIFFTHTSDTEVFAACTFKEQTIEVWLDEENPLIISELFQKLYELSEQNKQIQISKNGTDFISIQQLEDAVEGELPKIKATNGNWVAREDFDFFGMKGERGMMHMLAKSQPTKNINQMERVKDLITRARLKEALEALLTLVSEANKNEVRQLLERLEKLERDDRMGLLSYDEASRTRNRITNAALALCEEPVPKPEPVEDASEVAERSTAEEKTKILFLAANPADQSRIQTDLEHRILKNELQLGGQRDKFEFLPPQFAVTVSELLRAMNEKPNIVHFSGHGLTQGIAITTNDNQTQLVPIPALQRLFKSLRGIATIVILNACYSAEQAKVISEFGMYVVGNNLPITDPAAISFSKGFYNGIGEGKSFEDAFNDAMFVVLTENAEASEIIEVWKDGKRLDL
jgi:Leucine-rich repeat (LRR) protein